MPSIFRVTARNQPTDPHTIKALKGDIIPVRIDFSPWADDNSALTSATWTLKNGQASISAQAFSLNVATANISVLEDGKSLIEVRATNGTFAKVVNLLVDAETPTNDIADYV